MTKDQQAFESSRAEFIKSRIKEMQSNEPKLSFYNAWQRLQRDHPALFVEVPEEQSTYPPARSQRTGGREGRLKLARPALASLREAVGVPVKVVADDTVEHMSAEEFLEQLCREGKAEPSEVQGSGEAWVCIGPSTSIWAALE